MIVQTFEQLLSAATTAAYIQIRRYLANNSVWMYSHKTDKGAFVHTPYITNIRHSLHRFQFTLSIQTDIPTSTTFANFYQ